MRRIAYQPASAGSGGGGAPTVGALVVGPNYGETDKPAVGAHAEMPTIAFINNRDVSAQIQMPGIAFVNDRAVSAHLGASYLGAPNLLGVGITTQTANSTSVVMTPDATANDGDYLVVNICSSTIGASESFTAPSGWSLILSSTHTDVAQTPNLRTYTKFAGAGEPSSYTWTGGSNVAHIATIFRFSAVDTTTPINASAATTLSLSAADPVSPSITTTVANCFMLSVCVQQNLLTQTYTPPSGYVEQADQTGSHLGVAQTTGEAASRVQAAAGASGTATHNSNQTVASNYVAHHIAIAPGTLVLQA